MPDCPTLYVMVGLPGAGKSSYVNVLLAQRDPQALVLASDDIRATMNLHDVYKKEAERFVRGVIENYVRGCLRYGRSVIVDATNLTKRTRTELIWWAHEVKAKAECHWVKCDVSTSIRRSAKWIPKEDIERLASQFEEPTKEEGFDKLFIIT